MILERLRQHTAAQHTALEQKLPLLRPEFSLVGYQELLRRLFGFYEPLEQCLLRMRWAPAAFDYRARHKTPWLVQDLAALGDLSQVLESLPHCRALPPVTQCAEALGTLYVIEGATLGGQFIARHLAARFGLTPANGAAFFHSYGLQVGPRWQQFRAFLVSASAELEQERATIIASAQRTFQALDDWLFPHV